MLNIATTMQNGAIPLIPQQTELDPHYEREDIKITR
jgi:hypothetical protein